jgi:hypothetical protein
MNAPPEDIIKLEVRKDFTRCSVPLTSQNES